MYTPRISGDMATPKTDNVDYANALCLFFRYKLAQFIIRPYGV